MIQNQQFRAQKPGCCFHKRPMKYVVYMWKFVTAIWVFVSCVECTNADEEKRAAVSNPAYYDHLFDLDRIMEDDAVRRETSTSDSGKPSNMILYRITDADDNETVLRHAHITSLLPYTHRNRIRQGVSSDALAILLAIHQFNNKRISDVISPSVPDFTHIYNTCNIRLTTELFDTKLSPIESTKVLSDVILRKQTSGDSQTRLPPPTAVIGPYRSKSTLTSALLSGVNEIFHVSHHSPSTDLNDKKRYPFFGRTAPSAQDNARVTIQYLQQLKVNHVGVIFFNDESGSSYHKAFSDAATYSNYRISVKSFSFSSANSSPIDETNQLLLKQISTAIASMKASGVRYIVAMVTDEYYDLLMLQAAKQGIVGDNYVWIFTQMMSRDTFQANARYPKDSFLAKATEGIGIIQNEGGQSFRKNLAFKPHTRTDDYWPQNLESRNNTLMTTAFDKFRASYKDALADVNMMNYAKSKQPLILRDSSVMDIFPKEPSHDSYFIYDTVISLGLSMCYSPPEFLKGGDIFTNFTNDVKFEGASGMFEVDSKTGCRDHTNVFATMWNVRTVPDPLDDSFVLVDLVPTMNFMQTQSSQYNHTDAEWTRYVVYTNDQTRNKKTKMLDEFVYASGSTKPPNVYPLVTNQDILAIPRRVSQVFLVTFAILAFSSTLWTYMNRNTKVVKVSHPLFLCAVSLGSIIISLAAIPFIVNVSEIFKTAKSLECMLPPWFICIGFSISYSAFLTKLWICYRKEPSTLSEKSAFSPRRFAKVSFFVGFSLLIPLLVFTIYSPLEPTLILNEKQDFPSHPINLNTKCTSEYGSEFALTVLLIFLAWIVLALVLACRTDNQKLPYKNSDFNNIVLILAANCQTGTIAIPLIYIVRSSLIASYWMKLGLMMIHTLTMLLLTFIPKHLEIRKDERIAVLLRLRRSEHRSANFTRTTLDSLDENLSDEESTENCRSESFSSPG